MIILSRRRCFRRSLLRVGSFIFCSSAARALSWSATGAGAGRLAGSRGGAKITGRRVGFHGAGRIHVEEAVAGPPLVACFSSFLRSASISLRF